MKAMLVIENWDKIKKENVWHLLDELELVLKKYGLEGGFKF